MYKKKVCLFVCSTRCKPASYRGGRGRERDKPKEEEEEEEEEDGAKKKLGISDQLVRCCCCLWL